MKVICFGDSNTYGYDPRPLDGGRYDASCRWVDILQARTGWTVCNLGQNGREIPDEAPAFPPDTDLLIVMLGSNDLLQGGQPGRRCLQAGGFFVRPGPAFGSSAADCTARNGSRELGSKSSDD